MTVRRLFGLFLLVGLGLGQEARFEFAYPAYVYIDLNARSVNFDFTQDRAQNPGWLSRLDPAAYPTYALPAASRQGWLACLGLAASPTGEYTATPRPLDGDIPHCRFAPSLVDKSGARFKVEYRKTGDPACQGPLHSDADLLILANTKWKVQARIAGPRPPWVEPHVVPLTYKDRNTLCGRKPVPDARVRRYDKKLRRGKKTLSSDPSGSRGLAYYSQYEGVFALPLLYYLELDLGRLDPELADQTVTIEVEYLVRAR